MTAAAARLAEVLREKAYRAKRNRLLYYQPYPKQREFHAAGKQYRESLFAAGNQLGKEQPVDEPVLTPSGWREIGSLRAGDLVVAADGSITQVEAVFPQGVKPVWKLVLEGGKWTRAGLDHLWRVYTPGMGGWETLTTREILGRGYADCTNRVPFVIPLLGNLSVPGAGRKLLEVRPDGEAECVCISIAHPSSLYVTRDFIVTHNTWAGAFETAMHLTGRYPDWWEGRTFNKPVQAWAASVTSEVTRDGIQRLLFGTPGVADQVGCAAVPADAIVSLASKANIANAYAMGVVKWGGGGDVQAGESVVTFKSYDQGREKFQAGTIDVVWADEEPAHDIYMEMLTRTNASKGLVYMTFTPLLGMSQTIRRFLIDMAPGTHVTTMGIYDAPHYTKEEADRIIAAYPEHEREARAFGRPVLGSGAVWPIAESAITCDPFEIPQKWPRIAGMDIGWDHPTAGAWLAHDRDTDTIYLYDTYKASKAPVSVHASAFRSRGATIPVAWPHDALQAQKDSGRPMRDAYRAEGLLMLPEKASFEDGSFGLEAGVQIMYHYMTTGRFKVFRTCQDWLAEYRTYHRKDGAIVAEYDDVLCLHPDTVVLTSLGPKPIASLVGTEGHVVGRNGEWTEYHGCRRTRIDADMVTVAFEDGSELTCTPDHQILTDEGWVEAINIAGHECHNAVSRCVGGEAWIESRSSLSTSKSLLASGTSCSTATTAAPSRSFIVTCGAVLTAQFRRATTFITGMATAATTSLRTLSAFLAPSICRCITKAAATILPRPLPRSRSGARQMPARSLRMRWAREMLTSCTRQFASSLASAAAFCFPRLSGAPTASAATSASRSGAAILASMTLKSRASTVEPCSGPTATLTIATAPRFARVERGSQHPKAKRTLRACAVSPAARSDAFCMEVPNGNAFAIGNGVIVHNCASRYGFMMRRFAQPLSAEILNISRVSWRA